MCLAFRLLITEEMLELHDCFQVVKWIELGTFACRERLIILRDSDHPFSDDRSQVTMKRLRIVDEEYCLLRLQMHKTQDLFARTFVKGASTLPLRLHIISDR